MITWYSCSGSKTFFQMFTHVEALKFEKDADKFEAKTNMGICLNVYNEMVEDSQWYNIYALIFHV